MCYTDDTDSTCTHTNEETNQIKYYHLCMCIVHLAIINSPITKFFCPKRFIPDSIIALLQLDIDGFRKVAEKGQL